MIIHKKITLDIISSLTGGGDPLSPRLRAFAVTLSWFAGGEYLPFPRSKGGAFPSLLILGGYPTAPSNFARGQGILRGPPPLRLIGYVSLLITEGLHMDLLPLFILQILGDCLKLSKRSHYGEEKLL
jgi:hypothetical protein